MKKEVLNVLRLLSLFLFLAVVVVIAGETMFFIPNGNRTTNPDYVVPIINQPIRGFLAPASATVEATTEAVQAWWGNFTDRVEEAVSVQIGSTAGNIVSISVPKACIGEGASSPKDSNGIVTYNLSCQALEDDGDDNYTITFK